MKAEYDLSKLKARKNPYASKLKKPVTMRLSEDVVVYFKSMADEAGVPYQSLINLYLRDCLANKRKVQIHWLFFRTVLRGYIHLELFSRQDTVFTMDLKNQRRCFRRLQKPM